MPKHWLSIVWGLSLITAHCLADPAPREIRYLSDSQEYVDAMNTQMANSTLEASNLLLFKTLNHFYQHEFASMARIQMFMDHGEPVCIANKMQTPERSARYLFSYPVNLHRSHLLYQRDSLPPIPAEVLNERGEIRSLTLLFATLPQRTILLPFGRSFGELLDAQLAAVPDANKVLYRGGDLHDSEIDMFIKQRGDYLLTYPITIHEHQKALQGQALRIYAIQGHPKYMLSHVMCANTPETQRHIQKINQTLRQLYTEPELLNTHLTWLPESEHHIISQYYQQVTQHYLY